MELPFLSSLQWDSRIFLGRKKGSHSWIWQSIPFLPVWRPRLWPLRIKILHCTINHLWASGFPWICPHFCLYSSPSQFWLILACPQGSLSSHNAPLLWDVSPLSSWVLSEVAAGKAWESHTHCDQGHEGPLFHSSSCHSNPVSQPNTTSFLILLLNFASFFFLLLAISWNLLLTGAGVSASVRCLQVLGLLFKYF